MRRKSRTLTGQELEIMKIVWVLGSATVRDVYEALRLDRTVAYTTVLTMMKIMAQKGHLKKTRQDRAFVYSPARPKNQTVRSMVDDLIDRLFNGAAEPLLLHLVEERLSEKDLNKLRRMIEKRK